MPWAKLDDRLHFHPKLMRVGLAGTGLFVKGLSACSAYGTDGFIEDAWVQAQVNRPGEDPALPAALVKAGLWRKVKDGYRVHDFLDYNLSQAQFDARSKAGKKAAGQRHADASGNARSIAVPVPVPDPAPEPGLRPLAPPPRGEHTVKEPRRQCLGLCGRMVAGVYCADCKPPRPGDQPAPPDERGYVRLYHGSPEGTLPPTGRVLLTPEPLEGAGLRTLALDVPADMATEYGRQEPCMWGSTWRYRIPARLIAGLTIEEVGSPF